MAIEPDGHVVAAGWSCGLDDTLKWLSEVSETDTLAMIDAPLVVTNERGQRSCETAVGQRYGRWKVSANSTNLASPRLAGQTLRRRLEAVGWVYEPGWFGPRERSRWMSECYPWLRWGLDRCQVLGDELTDPLATIIAPARAAQRRAQDGSPIGATTSATTLWPPPVPRQARSVHTGLILSLPVDAHRETKAGLVSSSGQEAVQRLRQA